MARHEAGSKNPDGTPAGGPFAPLPEQAFKPLEAGHELMSIHLPGGPAPRTYTATDDRASREDAQGRILSIGRRDITLTTAVNGPHGPTEYVAKRRAGDDGPDLALDQADVDALYEDARAAEALDAYGAFLEPEDARFRLLKLWTNAGTVHLEIAERRDLDEVIQRVALTSHGQYGDTETWHGFLRERGATESELPLAGEAPFLD
ncbi:hypothetical protein ACX8Z9_04620 [Arthrobacter halodurans]|uniref:Uncharacterized protein n=1 Tax=Arthrobacter halodurans TaxID=516699 RepID=A0ABV4URZ0_9MICC